LRRRARAAALARRFGGERLSEHRLAHLLVEVLAEALVDLGAAGPARLDEFDQHRFRDDRGRVRPDIRDRAQERLLVGLGRAGAVFAQAQRLAENLRERHPVLEHVILEQVGPSGRASEPAAHRQAGLGLSDVHDKLERRERRRERLDSDSRIVAAPGVPARAAVMRCARARHIRRRFRGRDRRRVRRHQRPFIAQRAHQQFLAGDPVEHEPARVAPHQALGDPFAAAGVPDNLGRRKTLADRVEDIVQRALEVERATTDEVLHQVGCAQVLGRFGSRRDDQLGTGDRLFAGADHGQVVQVLLLHLFGQFEIEIRIAGFGLALDRDQFFGREPDRRMHHRVDIAHAGHGGRGLLVAQICGVDLAPVRIIEFHFFFSPAFF